MRSLAAKDSLDIYLDATGSVVFNIENEKRPLLYSVVVTLSYLYLSYFPTQNDLKRIKEDLDVRYFTMNIIDNDDSVVFHKETRSDPEMENRQACQRRFSGKRLN